MIEITEAAVSQIKQIQNSQKQSDVSLRLKVVGGGCSGMSYKMDFDTTPPTESDKIFKKNGIQIVVDAKSFLFLNGTTLDFSGGLNGKGFEFKNPNAKRSCGCGSSFSA